MAGNSGEIRRLERNIAEMNQSIRDAGRKRDEDLRRLQERVLRPSQHEYQIIYRSYSDTASIYNNSIRACEEKIRELEAEDKKREEEERQARDMQRQQSMQEAAQTKEATTINIDPSIPTDSLVKRGMLFLEDADWKRAEAYFEHALDRDPENATAYVGKLCVELQVRGEEGLEQGAKSGRLTQTLEDSKNYRFALRFGDEQLQKRLKSYNEAIAACLKQAEQQMAEKVFAEKEAAYELHKERAAKLKSKWNEIKKYQNLILCAMNETYGLSADGTVFKAYETGYFEGFCGQRNAVTMCEVPKKAFYTYPPIVFIALLKTDGTVSAIRAKVETKDCLDSAQRFDTVQRFENEIKDWRDIRTIYSHSDGLVGLKQNGTVVVSNILDDIQYNVDDWADIVSVSSGKCHIVGLKSDGTVVATGDNSKDQCNVDNWRDVTKVWCLLDFSIGLKSNGAIVATGDIGNHNINNWQDVVDIALIEAPSSLEPSAIGIKVNGDILLSHQHLSKAFHTNQWKNIVSIFTGRDAVFGLKSDGTVVATTNDDNLLFSSLNMNEQCNVNTWRDIVAVYPSHKSTYGLKSDGTVVAVGDNSFGQLNVDSWRDIVALFQHLLSDSIFGLRSDGTVVAAGNKQSGQNEVVHWRDIGLPNEKKMLKRAEKDKQEAEERRKLEETMHKQKMERQEWEEGRRKYAEEENRKAEERRKKIELRKYRKEQGLCLDCGGTYVGLFRKKCGSCGIIKYY